MTEHAKEILLCKPQGPGLGKFSPLWISICIENPEKGKMMAWTELSFLFFLYFWQKKKKKKKNDKTAPWPSALETNHGNAFILNLNHIAVFYTLHINLENLSMGGRKWQQVLLYIPWNVRLF